ncbi:MAG: phenylacetic acid degradation protein [Crocinitomicaceae bacterium]|nr:phenylacetic acid degradation protein [Crocinitomicaceae bacterium]
MKGLYELKIADVRRETAGCVSVALDIPEGLKSDFAYEAGQYLTLEADINGASVRRSYSLCSAPSDGEWRVAIKQVENGVFSTWANHSLVSGESIRCMAPTGRFALTTQPADSRNFIAFVAGSGITPVLSQIKEVLRKEPSSVFTLFYVNRDTPSIIFREALQELKDEYLERFRLFHILTREPQDIELFNGRLDEDRCSAILASDWVDINTLDAAFLCGPEEMIWACKAALESAGMASDRVKFELFTSSAGVKKTSTQSAEESDSSTKRLSIVMDGMTTVVNVGEGKSVLDAALEAGLDAPYSCMGGVCCTCRAKMVSGETEMDVNYALEPDEVEAGFVLTCQTKLKGIGPFDVDFDQQ